LLIIEFINLYPVGIEKKGSVETGMNMNGSHPTMKNCEGSTGLATGC